MPQCYVVGCRNSSRLSGNFFSYHSFPKNEDMRAKWLNLIGRAANTFLIYERICSDHFSKDDLLHIGVRRTLAENALPSKNLPPARAPAATTHENDADWIPTQNMGLKVINKDNGSNTAENITENIRIIIETDKEEKNTIDDSGHSKGYDHTTTLKEEIIIIKDEIDTVDEQEPYIIKSKVCPKNNTYKESEHQSNLEQKVSTSVEQKEDLVSICRGCLTDKDVVKMNGSTVKGIDVILMYEGVTKAKIDTTNVPAKMCITCISILYQSYIFLETLKNSVQILERMARDLIKQALKDHSYSYSKLSRNVDTSHSVKQSTISTNATETDSNQSICCKKKSTLPKNMKCPCQDSSKNIILSDQNVKIFNSNQSNPDQSITSMEVTCQICDKSVQFYSEHLELEHSVDWEAKMCLKCSYCTGSNKRLVEHVKMENGLMDIRCKECVVDFESVEQYIDHMNVSKCSNKTLGRGRKGQLKIDQSEDKVKNYACNKCDSLEFKNYNEVDKHFRENHIDESSCILCDKKFKYHWFVISHMAVHHGRLRCCRICLVTFETTEELLAHYKSPDHQTLCFICNKRFKCRNTLYGHRTKKHFAQSKPSKPYKCPECPQHFNHKANVSRHVRIIHREIHYLCDSCGKEYTSNLALRTHIQGAHKGETIVKNTKQLNKFVCEECGHKMMYDKWNIAVHKGKHSGHLFICKRCYEAFKTEDELTEHVKDKNHELLKCDKCFREFRREVIYKRHMKDHLVLGCNVTERINRRTGVKQVYSPLKTFECESCGKFFSTKAGLIDHRRVHTNERPYPCKICEKAFKTRMHLNRHVNIHLGIKKYICTYCGKGFALRQNLHSHEMIHTGKRPYKCGSCNKGFISSSDRKRHQQTHHKEETEEIDDEVMENEMVEEIDFEEFCQNSETETNENEYINMEKNN